MCKVTENILVVLCPEWPIIVKYKVSTIFILFYLKLWTHCLKKKKLKKTP